MRFTGFTDEWNPTPLNQMVERVTRKNTGEESKVALTISAQYGLVDQESFFNNKVASSDLSHYYLLYKGDYAYNKSYSTGYPWGAVKRLNMYDKGAVSTLYICFRPFDIVDSDFIGHYFESTKWHKGVSEIAVEGARNHGLLNIGIKDFFDTVHFIPSLAEQRKIANLLSLIDERIATQNKIIEDLKKLKSAIIDNVFCLPSEKQPNKRLDGFNGDWEIVKLSEICERMTDRNSDLKCNLVLTIAAQYGLVSQLDFFNKSVASENLSSYFVLKKGDFAYNKSYSGEYTWGAIKKLDYYEEGVLSPLYICFRPNKNMINSDFLALYFESKKWHRGISEIAGEGARNHGLLNISVIDFFNTIHRLPSLTEQIRIATVLQTYQNRINNEERLLLQYQTQRKFLLQTMFI